MLDPEAVEAKLPSGGSRYTWFVLGTCALSPAVVERCFADDEVHPLARNRHIPAEALARLARHPDAEIRRLVATRPDLGPEVAELRQDPDEDVRIRLACHYPLAPPHLLLDVFVTRPAHRPHLLTMPAFPRTGWTHLIGHPEPEMHAVAAADPTLPEPPLEDPEGAVRRAAAANPTLTPETLETLLADLRTAEGAAANPSLPVPRIHALLDLCLNGAATLPAARR
ncbi:hypothetical protein [Streptomyces sp. NBC_00233]|uniref:hypothetical protein n=1 Tax=Streptomyces sp. NBC_00233 TaxID=2975686 RepID=UPI00224DB7D3|nr:hypothetical protein [Streptomyces sp. NBC_00233]MCX5231398.1 hypothetical protein [Streptomyces sp. NBC_00233]